MTSDPTTDPPANEFDSIETGSVVDKSSGNSYDVDTLAGGLLGDAGYSSGDFFPLAIYGDSLTSSTSTTSNNFQPVGGTLETIVNFQDVPQPIKTRVLYRADPNGDQIDVKIRDTTNGVDVTGIGTETGTGFKVGQSSLSDFSPSNPSNARRVRVNIRNSDGSTSVSIAEAAFQFGVVL